MLLVALDACAPTHAKALPPAGPSGISGLEILDRFAGLGSFFITTKGVFGELVAMSLRETLAQWGRDGVLGLEPAPARRVRALDNRVPKKVARPGRKDMALVFVASTRDAVLLTHDNGACRYARAARVLTIDLLDVGALLVERKVLSVQDLDAVFAPFDAPGSFRPSDWNGSAHSTMLARPHTADLQVKLLEQLK